MSKQSIVKRGFIGTSVILLLAAIGFYLRTLNQASEDETSILTAEAMANPSQVDGAIEVWGWGIAAKSLNQLVPAFNRKYPKVTVDVNMTGANMQTRFFLSLAAGAGAPDVSQLQIREAPKYAETGQLIQALCRIRYRGGDAELDLVLVGQAPGGGTAATS